MRTSHEPLRVSLLSFHPFSFSMPCHICRMPMMRGIQVCLCLSLLGFFRKSHRPPPSGSGMPFLYCAGSFPEVPFRHLFLLQVIVDLPPRVQFYSVSLNRTSPRPCNYDPADAFSAVLPMFGLGLCSGSDIFSLACHLTV